MTAATRQDQAVRARLRDPAEHVRVPTLAALVQRPAVAGTLAPELAERVAIDPSVPARQLAVQVLALLGSAGVPGLAQGVTPRQPKAVRMGAAGALARVGPAAAAAVQPLAETLNDKDDDVRWHASFALGRIGAPAVVPVTRVLTTTADSKVRRACLDALGWVGPPAAPAAPSIRAAGDDPAPAVQLAAHSALARVTGNARASLSALSRLMTHADPAVRADALERVGELRSAARPVDRDVAARLSDPVASVRAAAVLTVARTETPAAAAVPALVPRLQDPDAGVRANVAAALASYGPSASPAAPALRALSRDSEARVRGAAAAALERITKPGSGAGAS